MLCVHVHSIKMYITMLPFRVNLCCEGHSNSYSMTVKIDFLSQYKLLRLVHHNDAKIKTKDNIGEKTRDQNNRHKSEGESGCQILTIFSQNNLSEDLLSSPSSNILFIKLIIFKNLFLIVFNLILIFDLKRY